MGRLRRADEALSSLERAVEHGWRDLVHLSIDPDLDSVRATVRYQALVEQLRRSGDGNGRVGDPVRPWPARVNELQRSVPALLARNGVHAATIAIVEDGVVVWSATFASGPRDAELTAGPIEAGAAVRLLALTALLRHGEPWTSLTDTGRDAQIRLAANPAAVPLESRIIRTVEDATGERFVDCCRRHVLEPLAMVDTRIAVPTGTRLSAPYGPPGTFLSAPYGPPGRHSLSYAAGNSSAAADRASWAVTTTAGDLGRLLEAICGATRDRPPAGWLDLAAQFGLDAWVDGRTEAVFLELSQPSGGGVIVLRWSPRLGRAVVVVTGRGDNGGTAGRIAALALGRG